MLFLMGREVIWSFWMKRMCIPLDFVWISSNCTVADVTANVPPPPPGAADNNLPTYSPSKPVLYVLELNAGQLAARGIKLGDSVRFSGPGLADQACSSS